MKTAGDDERYPWVYLAQWEVFGHVFSSYQTYLWQLSNLVTFNVLPGWFDRFRGSLVRKSPPSGYSARTSSPDRTRRSVASYASTMTTKTVDKIELGVDRLPFDPDLLLVIEVPKTIQDFRRLKCKKAYYAIDVHVSMDRYFDLAKMNEYDYVFVAQKSYVEPLKDRGCANVTWLPLCADPAIWSVERGAPKYDLAFIGNPYSHSSRDRLIRSLKSNLKERMFVGQAFLRDAARIYGDSKVVFNHSRNHDLNFRVFEGMCSGSLLLTDRDVGGLLDLFNDGENLATFEDEKEAFERLEHYLGDDDARERISKAGRSLVLEKHTYERRLRELLSKVGLPVPEKRQSS
jgi:glycosyltransferase involved in cell wall biosynthesis